MKKAILAILILTMAVPALGARRLNLDYDNGYRPLTLNQKREAYKRSRATNSGACTAEALYTLGSVSGFIGAGAAVVMGAIAADIASESRYIEVSPAPYLISGGISLALGIFFAVKAGESSDRCDGK